MAVDDAKAVVWRRPRCEYRDALRRQCHRVRQLPEACSERRGIARFARPHRSIIADICTSQTPEPDNGHVNASQAEVVLMCGIAGSGKTTFAQALERQGYVRLSIDETLWRICGRYGIDYEPAEYASHSERAEALVREELNTLLQHGRNVVVDNAFWQRKTRDDYKRLVEAAGARWRLLYLRAHEDVLRQRLQARRHRFDANAAFPVTDEILNSYLAAFEEPRGEGEEVIDVNSLEVG